jgi:hypothetical protein
VELKTAQDAEEVLSCVMDTESADTDTAFTHTKEPVVDVISDNDEMSDRNDEHDMYEHDKNVALIDVDIMDETDADITSRLVIEADVEIILEAKTVLYVIDDPLRVVI